MDNQPEIAVMIAGNTLTCTKNKRPLKSSYPPLPLIYVANAKHNYKRYAKKWAVRFGH